VRAVSVTGRLMWTASSVRGEQQGVAPVGGEDLAVVVDRCWEEVEPRSVIVPLLQRNPWSASVLVWAKPTTWPRLLIPVSLPV
jgi:hypothetical protein